jgi:hypothetical protein
MPDIDMMQHPVYKRVVELMFRDQGLEPPEDYIVGEEGCDDLEVAANFLATLSDDELEILAIGGQEEWPPIFGKASPETADATHRILDAIFIGIGA